MSTASSTVSAAWNDFTIDGRTYGLSHLNPFTMLVTPKAEGARTVKVYVSFGLHTFSKSWCEAEHFPTEKLTHRAEVRCFCPVRHGHSLHLPSIINQSATGRAYFSEGKNYLLVESVPEMMGPYAIFFTVEKARSRHFDVAMFIISAYEKPALTRELDKITFATLIAKTAANQQVKRHIKK